MVTVLLAKRHQASLVEPKRQAEDLGHRTVVLLFLDLDDLVHRVPPHGNGIVARRDPLRRRRVGHPGHALGYRVVEPRGLPALFAALVVEDGVRRLREPPGKPWCWEKPNRPQRRFSEELLLARQQWSAGSCQRPNVTSDVPTWACTGVRGRLAWGLCSIP